MEKQRKEMINYYTKLMKKSPAYSVCTPTQRLFVICMVLNSGIPLRAMREVFKLQVKERTDGDCSTVAVKMMKDPRVINAIKEFWELLHHDKLNDIEKKLVDLYWRQAFSSRSKYFNLDGTLKKGVTYESLGEDECLVEGIEKKYFGRDADVETVVYKLADRTKAADALRRMTGLDINRISILDDKGLLTNGVLRVPQEQSKEDWEKDGS